MQQALRSTVNVLFLNSSHVNSPSWLPVIYRTRLSYLCLLWIYCKWVLNPLETTKPWQAAFNENWHSLLDRPTLLSILQVNKEKKSNKYHWYLIFNTRKTNPYTLHLFVIHLHPYTYAKKKKSTRPLIRTLIWVFFITTWYRTTHDTFRSNLVCLIPFNPGLKNWPLKTSWNSLFGKTWRLRKTF